MTIQEITYLISLPLVGAFNGWFSTWLAIRMLFRPRLPVRIFGWPYQAPLPKRQNEIAQRIGEIVEQQLLSMEDFRSQAINPEVLARIEELVAERVADDLRERRDALPRLARKIVTDDILRSVKKRVVAVLAQHLPGMLESGFDAMTRKVKIGDVVTQRIERFDILELEDVILSVARSELRLIEYLCGVLGFVIGLAQLVLHFATR